MKIGKRQNMIIYNRTLEQTGIFLDWVRNPTDYPVDYSKTLVIVMDAWNDVSNLDSKMTNINNFLTDVRSNGGIVCFTLNEGQRYYNDHPCRQRVKEAMASTTITMPERSRVKNVERPTKVPKTQGKVSESKNFKVFGSVLLFNKDPIDYHLNSSIVLDEDNDIFSSSIKEMLTYFESLGRSVETVFFCGKHLNWCILNRPAGMEEWKRHGFENLIVKADCVVATNDPESPPYASQAEMDELHLRYIESFWGYSTE